ncbi:hypothetical protein EES43_02920 [Streptomyces sp. ADI96-02]|uniref:hypothetical protein n=1 Tax=Streptomyces sp. ADI96-02 TaxID=1522760 RepID=UPI000F54D61C|nr:hypothetical protein [Streptomyces sp. ADI96-02]RPK67627.1 hypothetical protein EES43_02920 [Streptomyces sp. ADI96-02]
MTIIVGNVVFGGPNPTTPGQQVQILVNALTAAGIQVGAYGRLLATRIKSDTPYQYASYAELAQDLTERRDAGAQINAVGDGLEAKAAAAVGAQTGRGGGQLPAWAVPFAVMPAGHQDPNVYARNGAGQRDVTSTPVKPDIWSDGLLGIVGGPAKDKNIQKFTTICHDLVRVCTSHQVRPVVFAAFGSQASVTEAVGIVGAKNTYVQDTKDGDFRPVG